jgi:hypothetical protein
LGCQRSWRAGITFADAVVTVSAAHAEELRTPEGGLGLHGAFATLGDRLRGIRNGVDERAWDPRANPALAARYAPDDLAGKRACKRALQRLAGLPERDDVPLLAFCRRLVSQKGVDLLLASRALAGVGGPAGVGGAHRARCGCPPGGTRGRPPTSRSTRPSAGARPPPRCSPTARRTR